MENVNVEKADIDVDVKELMNDEEILASLEDGKMTKRFILNCFCELLSEFKSLKEAVEGFNSTLTLCSVDKLNKFFKEVETNMEKEVKIEKLNKKIKESHKKPIQKSKKSVK